MRARLRQDCYQPEVRGLKLAQRLYKDDRFVDLLRVTHCGTNVTVSGASAPGPVVVSGAHSSAIGSQTASGANSSVVGSQAANGAASSVVGGQAVQARHDAVSAGQDATIAGAQDRPGKEGWWARLRKRGMVVAFAIIVG